MRNHQAVRDALIRQRWALHRAVEENDAAIAAWDALDDQHIADAQTGIADCRNGLAVAQRTNAAATGGYRTNAEAQAARAEDRLDREAAGR